MDYRGQKSEIREQKKRVSMIETYKDLKVYQKAYESSIKIHKITYRFPSFEKVELGGQIRRATKSIALNIAEGFGRQSSLDDFKSFLRIALGSCQEVKVLLDYSKDLAYMTDMEYSELMKEYEEISKMLVKMIKEWKK
jgi:four helix bundle protein